MRVAAFALLTIHMSTAQGATTSLHELVKVQLAAHPKVVATETLDSFAFESFVPVQSIEYRLGHSDTFESGESSDREQHRYTFNIKSFTELAKTPESRMLSRQLLRSERQEAVNQGRFDSYLALVNHLVSSRLTQVLETRRIQLQRIVDRYNHKLGQQKINAKDLLDDFRNLQKVEAEYSSAKEQLSDGMPPASDIVVKTLIDNVGATQKQLLRLSKDLVTPALDRAQIELRLDRINREIKWADDTKIVDSVIYQRSSIENEEAVRISFNVPFLRFDRENRSREQAMLRVKERELEMSTKAMHEKLRRNLLTLNGLAAQISSVRARFTTTNTLLGRLKNVQDLDLRSQLIELNSQLERDILTLGQRYYTLYLEYLRDAGVFGRMDVDFLDANWKDLSR